MTDPRNSPDVIGDGVSEPGLAPDQLVDLLRADQKRRWQSGQPLPVAAYLNRFPQMHTDSTCAVDLIWSEFLIRESLGDRPSLDDYMRDFPQFASLLEQQHRVHQWIEQAGPPGISMPTFADLSVEKRCAGRAEAGSRSKSDSDLGSLEAQGYEILDEIGRGGMGVVYRAYDRRREQLVALKMMRGSDPASLYRFKKEFRGLADISHPNLVALRELVSDGRDWFFTMDLIDGVDFLAFVRPGAHTHCAHPPTELQIDGPVEEHKLPSSEVVVVQGPARFDRLRDGLRQLAEGVAALHEAGWLHRDLKPSNVLVTPERRVVILDFGLGAELEQGGLHHASSTNLLGTAAYMSPEQAAGRTVTPASDWYSVGVILYEALTGRLPFVGGAIDVLMAKQRLDPTPAGKVPGELPDDLEELCSALLCRDPDARPHAADVLHALQSWTPGAQVPAPSRNAATTSRLLVGREHHLSVLSDAYSAMKQGGPVLVFVHGPSGAGKTALVETFLETLPADDGAIVLPGRCHAQESVPYKALDGVIDALGQALRRLPPAEVEAVLPRDFPYLCQVFPTLQLVEGARGPRRRFREIADPREQRKRCVAALRDLLGRLGDRYPLVLIIDDLHWGDQDSASLLVDLLEPPDPPALLLIGCYRRADAQSSSFLAGFMRAMGPGGGRALTRELPVDELATGDALALARGLCGGDFADTERDLFVAGAARESGGNPFFIGELVRYARHDSVRFDALSTGRPIRLVDVVEERLHSLSPEARQVLEVIAVFGRPIGLAEACRAAGVLENGPSVLSKLRAGRLIRTTNFQATQERYEMYHDRIRETLLSLLQPSTMEAHHLRLATTLRTMSYPDPEVLAIHYRGAGRYPDASRYFALAGDQSVRVLAFDRASALYRLAIELGFHEAAGSRGLRIKLGDALANAGRGGEAAAEYLAVAIDDSAESLDLRRRAAVQYLITGHVDQGLETLRGVVGAVGMKIPRSSWKTLCCLRFERVWVRLRGVSCRPGPTGVASQPDLTRIDICWSASIGLSIIDPIRGAVFQARSLRFALRAGEPRRIVRALAMEAAHVASAGRPSRARTASLLQAAESAARLAPEPYTQGMLHLARAISAYLEGRWKEARTFAEPAEAIFRDHCTGVAWEVDTARIFALWSLNYLGEIGELRRRWSELMKDAKERGDMYIIGTLGTLGMAIVRVADDDLVTAEEELREVSRLWSRQGFHIQHHNRVLASCLISLYRGDTAETWERLEMLRPTYARSLLLRVQTIRIELYRFRARGALAASRVAADPGRLVEEAARTVRSLEREDFPAAAAHALSIRAQIAVSRGATSEARSLFEGAICTYRELSMSLFAAATQRSLGSLLGGDEGMALVVQADQWMTSQGIRNPARMAALYVASGSSHKP